MNKHILLIFLTFLGLNSLVNAQELNCTVQVQAPQVSNVDKKVFETLQTAIFEFMNNTRWTNDIIKNDERIECNIQITISQAISSDEFNASILVTSRRPVYKSSYNTPMISLDDKEFTFRYVEYQPIEFSENAYTSNLSSVLAFYAYLIIGFDYDSFSPEGGTPYFQRASTIVNNAQNSPNKGWKAFESNRNRYWLAENMLNVNFKPFRQTLYQYHRSGLDIMNADIETGRAEIYKSIEELQKVYNAFPGSYLLYVFFFAKSDEVVNIFTQAFPETKSKITAILNQIDPANTNKYARISAQ